MELIPETAKAIADFGPFVMEDVDLKAELLEKAEDVRALVPQCLGLSLASGRDGLTFTVVATANEIAVLDAIQYVGGGPCVGAVAAERVVAYEQTELFDEHGWLLFAQATAAAGVASTLSLPILADARVVGSINLYAATPTAFDGHHEAIARVFDAWAPGAISNADLSFTTRNVAERAPDLLRGEIDLAVASCLLARQDDVSVEAAEARLRDAARSAGVTPAQLAQTIIELGRIGDKP